VKDKEKFGPEIQIHKIKYSICTLYTW